MELTREIEQLVLDTRYETSEVASGTSEGGIEAPPSPELIQTPKYEVSITESLQDWQRVTIRSEPNGDLTFLAIKDGKRVEQRVKVTQLMIVDEIMCKALASTRADSEVGRILLQLLVPRSFEHLLFRGGGTVLVLDETSARFPWELLSTKDRLPALEAPIVRELPTTRFEPMDRTSDGGALIIGDPLVDSPSFSPLPGAAIEANRVAQVLRHSGQMSVNEVVGASAAEVISAWFRNRWQILHFAGHGVVNYDVGSSSDTSGEQTTASPEKITGLVLGNTLFITAAEVAQMRVVPDLVFLNAAHMGLINGVRRQAPDAGALTTEFAMLGCRAIIAPGWTIDDAAAVTFAEAFYKALLDGETFGHSVTMARKATFAHHPNVNTWAAYQCYGDPDFILSDRR